MTNNHRPASCKTFLSFSNSLRRPFILYYRYIHIVVLLSTEKIITMSDLQRSFAKVKLANLPFEPPLPPSSVEDGKEEEEKKEDDDDELDSLKPVPDPTQDDDSSSASSASSASSTGTIRPSPSKLLFARPKGFVQSSTFYRYLLLYVC